MAKKNGRIRYISKKGVLWGRVEDKNDNSKIYDFKPEDVDNPSFCDLKRNDSVKYNLRSGDISDEKMATNIEKVEV